MKKIVFGLFIFVVSLSFYNVKALDEREVLSKVEATSNINSVLIYASNITNPTFNTSLGTVAHFDTTDTDSGWYRYENERWIKRSNNYPFGSGEWQYRVKVVIDGEDASLYKLNGQTKINIDGEDWFFSYSSSNQEGNTTTGVAYSPHFTLEPTGELFFFSHEKYIIYKTYNNQPAYSISVRDGVEGGVEPYTFTKVSGPDWLNVSSDGTVGGTPLVVGDNESIVVRVTDSESNSKEITVPVEKTILTPMERELVEEITATSNIESIPVLDNDIVIPTFTKTTNEGATFASYAGGWYKLVGSNWKLQESGKFTPGKWQYRTEVRLQDEPAETKRLSNETKVYVDSIDWNAELSGTGNEFYSLSIKSPEYIVLGEISSIKLEGSFNEPKIGDDITEPIIWVVEADEGNELAGWFNVEAKWQYKTGDGFFDWADATGKFEANKTYHIRLLVTLDNDYYTLKNIANYPVTFDGYDLTQFQLNDKTVGEFIEFEKLVNKEIKTPVVSIKNDNNKITLSWESQDAATKFLVYRSTNNKKYSKAAEVTTNSYVQKGLTYNKTYYYKVKACDNSKCTNYSNIVSKKIKPNKVKLNIKSAGTNNIKLNWEKVSTTGYQVSRSTNNKKWTTIKTITKNSTLEFNNKKLKANKMYYYKVRAYKTVSGKKIYGSWSTVVSTKTAPVKPKLTLSIKNYDSINIKVGESKGASKYILYRSTDGKTYEKFNELTKTATVYIGGNVLGKTYYFQVKACNKYNRCSGKVTLSIKQTTKTPSLKVTSSKTKKVDIVVGSSEEADGYRVYRSTSKNGKYEKIKEITNSKELSFTDKTKKGYTYYYKVRSYKKVNGSNLYSPYSGIKKIVSK